MNRPDTGAHIEYTLQEYLEIMGYSAEVARVFWMDDTYDRFARYTADKFGSRYISNQNMRKLWYQITGKED